MGLDYVDLDEVTREYMLGELGYDKLNNTVHMSDRLNDAGKNAYVELLTEAIKNHDDVWLTNELRNRGYFNTHVKTKKKSGGYSMNKMPSNAEETLAEGEFNRFYIRGVCARAIKEGIDKVLIYRGKVVTKPRIESEALINTTINPKSLLEDLREAIGKDTASRVPGGPNSGLTVKLP